MPINELRAIATFAKAVELGSLRKAAASQGMSPQAASQALSQLEQHLGVRLLHRTTRNIALTEEGQEFLEAAQPALASLERALQRARSARDEDAGSLRIVGPSSGFPGILWPLIDEYSRLFPAVQPDVLLEDRIGNWVEDRVDVGFRIGAQAEEGVIARHLLPIQLIICAAPAYIERFGAPASLDELAMHRCSAFRRPRDGRIIPWSVKVDEEIVSRDVPPALSTNSVEFEIEAVLAGRAIGQLAAISVAPQIRSGQLVPLLTRHLADHLGLFLYYGSRKAQPSRVRAFIDLALQRLSGNRDYMLDAEELTAFEEKGRRGAGLNLSDQTGASTKK